MHVPVVCLLIFVAWTLALVMTIATLRAVQVVTGRSRADTFPAGVPHGSPFYWRLNRAHLNCVENLPLFAGVVLAAAVLGASSPLLDHGARLYLGARLAQSITHLIAADHRAVLVRFTFFVVQLGALAVMLATLLL